MFLPFFFIVSNTGQITVAELDSLHKHESSSRSFRRTRSSVTTTTSKENDHRSHAELTKEGDTGSQPVAETHSGEEELYIYCGEEHGCFIILTPSSEFAPNFSLLVHVYKRDYGVYEKKDEKVSYVMQMQNDFDFNFRPVFDEREHFISLLFTLKPSFVWYLKFTERLYSML